MSQAAYVQHPHGPDIYVTVPATAGPNAESFLTYLGHSWSWYVPGAISVIRELGADGMLAAHNGIPNMRLAQRASVGDWLVPVDKNHDGICDDIILVRHNQKWRTLFDERAAYNGSINKVVTFEGHRLRLMMEINGATLTFVNGGSSVALEWSGNMTKHDGSGTYRHENVAVSSASFIFGAIGGANLKGSSVIVMECVKRSDDRWIGSFSGFLNVHSDANVSNMGGDYWSIEGRLVWSAGTPVFGFGALAGDSGAFSMHVEVEG